MSLLCPSSSKHWTKNIHVTAMQFETGSIHMRYEYPTTFCELVHQPLAYSALISFVLRRKSSIRPEIGLHDNPQPIGNVTDRLQYNSG